MNEPLTRERYFGVIKSCAFYNEAGRSRWCQLLAVCCAAALAITLALGGEEASPATPKKAAAKKADLSKLPAPADKKVDFGKDIKPILKESCLDCHDADGPMGKFRLDKRELALKGGESGVDIKPGKSAESPLIHYVAQLVEDMEMPPKGQGDPLTKAQIALLRAWIDQGVKWE